MKVNENAGENETETVRFGLSLTRGDSGVVRADPIPAERIVASINGGSTDRDQRARFAR